MTDAPVTSAAIIDGVDVDAVAAAVTACPGVSDLFGGRGDAIASYLPGRRVPGVEISSSTVLITVRSRWDATAADLLGQLSRMVTPLLHGKRLEVVVADIDDPNESPTPVRLSAPAPVTVAAVSSNQPLPAVTARPSQPSPPVRLPGSSPAPSAPAPVPSPPNFPTV